MIYFNWFETDIPGFGIDCIPVVMTAFLNLNNLQISGPHFLKIISNSYYRMTDLEETLEIF